MVVWARMVGALPVDGAGDVACLGNAQSHADRCFDLVVDTDCAQRSLVLAFLRPDANRLVTGRDDHIDWRGSHVYPILSFSFPAGSPDDVALPGLAGFCVVAEFHALVNEQGWNRFPVQLISIGPTAKAQLLLHFMDHSRGHIHCVQISSPAMTRQTSTGVQTETGQIVRH